MNHLFFRTLPRKVLSMLAVTVLASSAALAAFPDKPIRVVIGFPAGGMLVQRAAGRKADDDADRLVREGCQCR